MKYANWYLTPIFLVTGLMLLGSVGDFNGPRYAYQDPYEEARAVEALHKTWQFKVIFAIFLVSTTGLLVKNRTRIRELF